MLELGAKLESRDLNKERLSEAELEELIGGRDYKEFLNPRNELYRKRNMKEKPLSRSEAIKLMAEESYPPARGHPRLANPARF